MTVSIACRHSLKAFRICSLCNLRNVIILVMRGIGNIHESILAPCGHPCDILCGEGRRRCICPWDPFHVPWVTQVHWSVHMFETVGSDCWKRTHQCRALNTTGSDSLDNGVDLLETVSDVSFSCHRQPPWHLPIIANFRQTQELHTRTHHRRPTLTAAVGLNAPNISALVE